MQPAGKKRKRIQIQALPANPPAVNAYNEQDLVGAWVTQKTVWASIEPKDGREFVWAAAVTADATHIVMIRYYRGLSAKMRFLYHDPQTGTDRALNIRFVQDVEEKHIDMVCWCKESVA